MSEKHRGTTPEPESQEGSWDAFKPVSPKVPSPGQETDPTTGWWTAPPPTSLDVASREPSDFLHGGSPEAPSRGPSEGSPAAPPERGRRRKRRLPRAVRAALLIVAAVASVAVTIGVQWWDRSGWVAERYPDEVIKDVGHGQVATLRGVRWQVDVAARPRAAGDDPAVTSLVATVQVTPATAADVKAYYTPGFQARDEAGHKWEARDTGTLSTLDMKPGKTERLTVVAAVPNRLKDTAEIVLSYSSDETLRFAR